MHEAPNNIFALPMHHLRNFNREPRKKKKSQPLSQHLPDQMRVFSSYGNSRESSRRNLHNEEPFLRQGKLEFNFTKLLQQNLTQPAKQAAEETRIRDYRSLKTVFPSSFYRIKQQLRSRRNPQQWTALEQEENASLNIKRVGM